MAYLQTTCVIGTLAISASNTSALGSILISDSFVPPPEFDGNCNLIAIGQNTSLTGSLGLDTSTLVMTQNGLNFNNSYNYYQVSALGCTKPTITAGGGGGTGATFQANPARYTNYYANIPQGSIFGVLVSNPGCGYTSTVTGTVCDPTTAGETCALFTVEPLTNENSINIGHNAGCRSQGQNTIRIGSCAGRGNLDNSYCMHTDSIAIGSNTMLSGSFICSIAIGENALKGNTTCTNVYKNITNNVVIGKNSLCNFKSRVELNTVVGNCNFPNACCVSYSTILGYCNGFNVCGGGTQNAIIGWCNLHTNGTVKNIGNQNVLIGVGNFKSGLVGNSNIAIGEYNMCAGPINNASDNIAIGCGNLLKLTTGDYNIAQGIRSLLCMTTGQYNVSIGAYAGLRQCTGARSVYIGCGAACGMGNQTDSIFIGNRPGMIGGSTSGGHIVIGTEALRNMNGGYFNTVIGYCALAVGGQTSTTCSINGGCNIAIGYFAGQCIKLSSNNNIYIGQRSGPTVFGAEVNKFYLGQGAGNHLMCGCLSSVGRTLCVNGTLSKTAGSFAISHPNPTKTQACELWHSFVESPTAGDNLYRFEVKVENGQTTMDLPDYYKHLNEDDQVWVNAKNHFGKAYGVLNQEQTTLTVFADTDGEYNILLIGTRKDKDAVNAWKGIERKKQN